MKLKFEDVGEKMEILLDIVGEEKFIEITKMYGGNNIYIPTYKSTIRNYRNREIREKYTGFNVAELALQYGISVNQLRNILNDFDEKV